MKEKISYSTLFFRQSLVVDDGGVKFIGTEAFQTARRFTFDQILCVLMGPDNTLSFQVGDEVFAIPTNPGNRKHQAAIAALLQGLGAAAPAGQPAY